MKNHDVESLFSLLGISEQAKECYVSLLKLKTARGREIAEATGIHRTVIYKPLDELKVVGLLSEKRVGGVKTYTPAHPQFIQTLIDERMRHARAALPGLLEQFSETAQSRAPKIRFYADLLGIRSVLEEILLNKDKFYRVIGVFYDEAFLQALGDGYLRDWTRRRIEMKVHHQSLRARFRNTKYLDPCFYAEDPLYFREVRCLDLPSDLPMLTYLYEEKVAFVSARLGGFYAAVFESKDLFLMQSAMFEILWGVGQSLTVSGTEARS